MSEEEELKNKWLELVRKNKLDEAEELYRSEIFPKIKEKFTRWHEFSYEFEILTVGNRARPLVISITAIKPKRVFFLCTRESESTIDEVVKECMLKPSDYGKARVERANAEDVYKAIKEAVEEFEKDCGKRNKICIDITGGTKAMVAGAAIAGAMLSIPLIYIKSIEQRGGAVPFTEEITQIANPADTFGTLDEKIAMTLFDRHLYAGAIEILGRLCDTTREPTKFEIEENVAKGYAGWDRFEYGEALKMLKEARNLINTRGICRECCKIIETNIAALEKLRKTEGMCLYDVLRNDELAHYLILDMYENAVRRAEEGKFEDAVIRLYRVLEFLVQYRLAKLGIDTENVDVSKLDKNVVRNFKDGARSVYGAEREIPKKISLMDGLILLKCLKPDDEVFEPLTEFDALASFHRSISPRNTMIVVHGISRMDEKKYNDFKALVDKYIKRVIRAEEYERITSMLKHGTSKELFL